ncbi:MAG: Na+/H+ antiporter NhaC [Firmicutes bacterium]|nr:Na+/H+ antiporter NhaC [Bacillota bacterium]
MKEFRTPSIKEAVLLVAVIAVFLFIGITQWHAPTSVLLIISAAIAAVYAMVRLGYDWGTIQEGIVSSISTVIPSLLILLTVGALIGTWVQSGTVPVMIYYGLKFLPPHFFLAAVVLIAALVSLATGTSWGTVGTVGVAFMGISAGLGIPAHITAGAIVVGAFFGDKMSPLSDTTNLAAAVSGSDLFDHIKHMLLTTGPAMLISLVIFGFIGYGYGNQGLDIARIQTVNETLQASFNLNPLLLLPPVLVIYLVIKRKPVLPVLFLGTILAGFLGLLFQGASLPEILNAMSSGFSINTGEVFVDKLLNRGGIMSMTGTTVLVLAAVTFGGVMRHTGILGALLTGMTSFVRGTGSLIFATVLANSAVVLMTGSCYVSMSLIGPLFAPLYDRFNLARQNLSRTLEDTGTVLVPLIPWSITGGFVAETLGVPVTAYLPFAFMCYLSIVFALVYGFTGKAIVYNTQTGENSGANRAAVETV